MLIRIYFYTIFMLMDINSTFELQFAYRIHANRTPLLIRTPGYTFVAHCGPFL